MKKRKIMVIDDDQEFLDEMKDVFEANDFCAICLSEVNNGFIKKTIKIKPDIILLDLKLKNNSWIQIFNELKGNSKTSDIPIMAVTGVYKDIHHAELVKEVYGMQDFIIKPFDPSELILKIRILLEKQLINKEIERLDKIEMELDYAFQNN